MTSPLNDLVVKTERGSELHQRLISLSVNTTRNFFEFGEILKEIRDNELWLAMGYETFESYFADPELSLSKSSVYHAISLVEHFPEWREIMPVPISKLIMIIPYLNEENKPKLLECATGLSRSDLKNELSAYRIVDKGLSYEPVPTIYRCRRCGKIRGVFVEDVCVCQGGGEET